MPDDRFMSAAMTAVGDACRVARMVQHDLEGLRQITKDDKSPVTVADFAVQAMVALGLRQRLGETLIVGEEHARLLRLDSHAALLQAVFDAVRAELPEVEKDEVLDAIDACDHNATAEAYWTLDPIDGTKGFLRGEQYAIALGYLEYGEVVLGVMGCPNLPVDQRAPLDQADPVGVIYAATRGSGAWEYNLQEPVQEPRRIHAAKIEPTRPIRACESVESAHSSQEDSQRVLAELGNTGEPVRLDSQCKYAVVARGQADVYLRMPTRKGYVEKVWDHAAGLIIAAEAGAIVSDITGAPLDFTHGRSLEVNRGIVCAVAGLHPRLLQAMVRLGIGATA